MILASAVVYIILLDWRVGQVEALEDAYHDHVQQSIQALEAVRQNDEAMAELERERYERNERRIERLEDKAYQAPKPKHRKRHHAAPPTTLRRQRRQ